MSVNAMVQSLYKEWVKAVPKQLWESTEKSNLGPTLTTLSFVLHYLPTFLLSRLKMKTLCVLLSLLVATAAQPQTQTGVQPASIICSNAASGYIFCGVGSNDPNSTVTWTMRKDGNTYNLGTCRGNTMSCTAGVSRWYSWSWITVSNSASTLSGATLTCAATHYGRTTASQCTFLQAQRTTPTTTTTTTTTRTPINKVLQTCCVGETSCRLKSWSSCGSINGVRVCCPAGQGLILNMSSANKCQCNNK